jgi:hypothetical protein
MPGLCAEANSKEHHQRDCPSKTEHVFLLGGQSEPSFALRLWINLAAEETSLRAVSKSTSGSNGLFTTPFFPHGLHERRIAASARIRAAELSSCRGFTHRSAIV